MKSEVVEHPASIRARAEAEPGEAAPMPMVLEGEVQAIEVAPSSAADAPSPS